MITKTSPIIAINITQIIDSTLNQNFSFSILKYTKLDQMDRSKLKWTKLDDGPKYTGWAKYTELGKCGTNGPNRLKWTELYRNIPKWTKLGRSEWSRSNGPNLTEMDQSRSDGPKWTEHDQFYMFPNFFSLQLKF